MRWRGCSRGLGQDYDEWPFAGRASRSGVHHRHVHRGCGYARPVLLGHRFEMRARGGVLTSLY